MSNIQPFCLGSDKEVPYQTIRTVGQVPGMLSGDSVIWLSFELFESSELHDFRQGAVNVYKHPSLKERFQSPHGYLMVRSPQNMEQATTTSDLRWEFVNMAFEREWLVSRIGHIEDDSGIFDSKPMELVKNDCRVTFVIGLRDVYKHASNNPLTTWGARSAASVAEYIPTAWKTVSHTYQSFQDFSNVGEQWDSFKSREYDSCLEDSKNNTFHDGSKDISSAGQEHSSTPFEGYQLRSWPDLTMSLPQDPRLLHQFGLRWRCNRLPHKRNEQEVPPDVIRPPLLLLKNESPGRLKLQQQKSRADQLGSQQNYQELQIGWRAPPAFTFLVDFVFWIPYTVVCREAVYQRS